ncbi:MAG: hypothetical protein Kow0068_16540 [Marinilabiliales bacterium]
MKKLTFGLRPSKKNIVNGIAPITLRITMERKSTYISLGKMYSIPYSDWDFKKELPKRSFKYEKLTNNIRKLDMVVDRELMKINGRINEYSLSDIRELIKTKIENIDEVVEEIIEDREIEIDFLTYFKQHIERKKEMGKYGTYDNYSKIYSNVHKYLNGKRVPLSLEFDTKMR